MAIDSNASNGSKVGRTASTIKETEEEEPSDAELLIRPHIATFFRLTSLEDGGALPVSSVLEEEMRPSDIERSEDKDET